MSEFYQVLAVESPGPGEYYTCYFGLFCSREAAEQCVIALAGRPGICNTEIKLLPLPQTTDEELRDEAETITPNGETDETKSK